jgi:hypothetical protein
MTDERHSKLAEALVQTGRDLRAAYDNLTATQTRCRLAELAAEASKRLEEK